MYKKNKKMIYDYSNIEKLFVFGDVHGEFNTLFNSIKLQLSNKKEKKIKVENSSEIDVELISNVYQELINVKENKNNSLNDSVMIVAGDCGIGFNKYQYYIDVFTKINDLLNENNSHLLFIRGNHDDPSYFAEQKINFSNIKCIPDYSIVKTKEYTTLCVGGGISIDRIWRKSQEHQINKYSKTFKKKLYWDDEAPIYDETALKNIFEDGIKIDSVITHSSTEKMYPSEKNYKNWLKIDKELAIDVPNERATLSKIYDFLKANNCEIKFWAYGHFHEFECGKLDDYTYCISLPDTCIPYCPSKIIKTTISNNESFFYDLSLIKDKIPLF